jgi:hypothetical protein
MKKTLLLSIISLIALTSEAQEKDYKSASDFNFFAVAKDEKMIAYGQKTLWSSDGLGKDWVKKETNINNDFNHVQDLSIFNSDTLFISGYLYDDNSDSYILRTTDNGKSWEKVFIPNSKGNHYIDAVFSKHDGNAWLAQPDSGIYFSNDFGSNWKNVGKIPRKNTRADCIFFKDDKIGAIGSSWCGLFLTKDNCKTWETLKTPFEQNKIKKIFRKNEPPRVTDVILYNDDILVEMDDKWFYSKMNNIDWKVLPHITKLKLDVINNVLYGLNEDRITVQYDSDIKITWKSEKKIPVLSNAMQVVGGTIFFLVGEEVYKINKSEFKNALNYESEKPIEVPLKQRSKATFITWGWNSNSVYHSEDLGKTWYRVYQIATGISHLVASNDSIAILYNATTMERFEFNNKSKQLKTVSLNNPLDIFLSNPLSKISIEMGSRGCFHSWSSTIEYFLDEKKGLYITTNSKKEGNSDNIKSFKDYKNRFEKVKIDSLLTQINTEPEKKLTFSDFKIQKTDIDKYLKTVKKFKTRGNKIENNDDLEDAYEGDYSINWLSIFDTVDIPFFEKITENLNISDETLKEVFCNASGRWSTTTDWRSLILENTKGEKIIVTNNSYDKTSYYLPWTITYKNLIFKSTDVRIAKFIQQISPKGFLYEGMMDNSKVICRIASHLYVQKLKNE